MANWDNANLDSATDQHFLGIHRWNANLDSYDLIASTDRSHIIGRRAEVQSKSNAGTEYHVHIALRNNGTSLSSEQTEVTFEWKQNEASLFTISLSELTGVIDSSI